MFVSLLFSGRDYVKLVLNHLKFELFSEAYLELKISLGGTF